MKLEDSVLWAALRRSSVTLTAHSEALNQDRSFTSSIFSILVQISPN